MVANISYGTGIPTDTELSNEEWEGGLNSDSEDFGFFTGFTKRF